MSITVTTIYKNCSKLFPPWKEIYLVFSVCVFPIHSWAFIIFLYHLPALIKKASKWQVIGVFAYSFSVAFVESILLTFFILLIGMIPIIFIKERFVFLGTSLALILSSWIILINIQGEMVRNWLISPLLIVIILFFLYTFMRPSQTKKAKSVAERLTIISSLFVVIDIFCILIVIIRNIPI
jgi:hypothetical protein